MGTIFWIFPLAGYFLAGFFAAQIAQRIVVPLLVSLLGERYFASPSAFDGCTLGITGGFLATVVEYDFLQVGPVSPGLRLSPFYESRLWIFALIVVGVTFYGVAFLWFRGFGGRKRQWKITSGHIFKKTEELYPTFIRERSDYNQTDAFNGYSHYFLELHSDIGLLATNAYNSKDEFKRDIERVRELTNAKRLDLVWSWRVETRKWMVAYFPDEWALFLCGPLDRLAAEDRQWWQGWIYPDFAERVGTEVNTSEAVGQVERLKKAYGEEMQNRNPNIAEFAEKLRRLLMSEGPVIALNHTQFDDQVNQVRENADMFWHEGDFAELRP